MTSSASSAALRANAQISASRTDASRRESFIDAFQADHLRRQRQQRNERRLLNLASILLFLLVWELLPHLVDRLNPVLFPPPSSVLKAAWPLVQSGELATHILASLARSTLGFAIALVLGIVAGVSMARVRFLEFIGEPILHAARSVPSIAVVPLMILWFGIDETPKIALIALGAFFPIWMMTFIGVRDVNPIYLRSAATFGTSRRDTLFLVILPAALPFILAGMRQAVALSLVLLVAAELSGSKYGIAYMMSLGHQLFQVEIMFIGLALLGVFGFAADRLFTLACQRLFPWYQSGR